MENKQDVFYKVNDLTLEKKIEIINDAFEQKYTWWVDILDCSVSSTREPVEMTFKEIMEKFDKNAHFVVIHRRGYLEVGFRSSHLSPEWFLWIYCEKAKIPEFVKKYKLEKL